MWICVYPNWKTNFNSKNGKKISFSNEAKALIPLSQWGKWICGAQLLKERRLLCESIFIPIERWTLILKLVEREVFPTKLKHHIICPNEEKVFMAPNHENKGDYYVNSCLS